ncbi:MAG TPA: flagellar export chaperone FliS [Solirubrobacteraceae bacterium]|nr:flagellar export chaperone FliS [Solirubrobacteraceae bacterium]
MSTYAAYSPNANASYRASAVLTASPGQLVVMLYDGARRFLHQAAVAMGDHDIATAHNKLTRAEDIIRHLRSTLDMDQGELPVRLQSIYTFSLSHLRQARLDQDPSKVLEIDDMLGKLRESWAAIADQPVDER